MRTVTPLITKHSVPAYFALTFAISWGGMFLAIGGAGGMRGTTPASDPRFAYALAAMLVGPSVTGILMTAIVHGRTGMREFVSRLLAWRVGTTWYFVALLTAPALMTATLLALSSASEAFVPGIFASDRKGSLVLIVGIWWSAWHLLPNMWAARAAAGELAISAYMAGIAAGIFVGYLAAFRVLMVWVYDRTESLVVGMLMHASFTASLLILNPLDIAGAHLLAYSFALASAVWVMVAAVASTSRWHLWRLPLRRRTA